MGGVFDGGGREDGGEAAGEQDADGRQTGADDADVDLDDGPGVDEEVVPCWVTC